MKTLVIIDSYALAHRAYHALPPLVSPQGVLVNGVYGFLLVFLKMLDTFQPDYVLATFDSARPTFRHEEYKEYKAQRTKAPDNFYEQIKIIKEILTLWGIPLLEKPGFEADDIIGTLTEKLKQADLKIIILTGDLDALQLVNQQVVVSTFRKGLQDSILYDETTIKEKYGLTPSQLIDFKALKGDPSDNILGVPGIGEKTALKLIQTFQSLDHLYEVLENQLPEITQLNSRLREKLKTYKKEAFFSRHLVTIKKDVPLEISLKEAVYQQPKKEILGPYLEKLGFQSLLKRLFPQEEVKNVSVSLVKTFQDDKDFAFFKEQIKTVKEVGLFLNYQGKKYKERQVFGLYLILPSLEIWYLPQPLFGNISSFLDFFKEKTLFCFEAKEIIEEIPLFTDLMLTDLSILAWLLDPERKNYSLESLIKYFLKEQPSGSVTEDLKHLFALGETLTTKITALGLEQVWATIEQPLIPLLSQMEKEGILVNQKRLAQLTKEINEEIKQLEQQIYQLAQKTFNINSYQQLREVLFSDLKIDSSLLKKTRQGQLSTDIFELAKIKTQHPIIPLIINYRQLEKLKTAFLEPLAQFIDPSTSKVHTIWKQTGTATGRLSSEEPNLQNIPTRGEWGTKIRSLFEAREGFSLLSLDYSQIELRLASHLSLDPLLKEAFLKDKDIHTLTASYLFQVPETEVTTSQRQLAKVLNFGILYGMGDKLLSETAEISLAEAKKFKQDYFERFPGLKMYLTKTIEQAKKNGYVETLFGRKRFLPLIGSLGQRGRQEERVAVNTPIQGLAADIIKLAMIKINKFLKQKGKEDKVKLLLQIHDELIFEVKNDIIEEIAPQLKEIMEQIVQLEVPLKVNIAKGVNWGELH